METSKGGASGEEKPKEKRGERTRCAEMLSQMGASLV